MYRKLTVTESLYVIKDIDLKHFKDVASQYEMLVSIEEKYSLNVVDNWSVVLSIWCLFWEEERKWTLDYSKMIVYSCNFLSADILRKTNELNNFFRTNGKTDRTVFLLSYHVARELLIWTYDLLAQCEEGYILMEKNYGRNYFLLMADSQLLEDEKHQHYADQKLMTMLMAQSYTTSDTYKNHIKTAIQHTREYLRKSEV